MDKKYLKYIGIQALGMTLLLLFVKQFAKYDFFDFDYFVWCVLSGIALRVTYYGLRKEHNYRVKQENKDNAND